MSLCVVSVTPERALVAVDTACEILGQSEHVECAKLHLLPHANLVLAGVGTVGIIRQAFEWISLPRNGADFDWAAANLREALDRIYSGQLARPDVDEAFAALLDEGNNVYLVGWSALERRMLAQAYIQEPGGGAFKTYAIDTWAACPWNFSTLTEQPLSVDEIAAAASEAVCYGKAKYLNFAIGGRLVIAEVGRDRVVTYAQPVRQEPRLSQIAQL
jgi:hypothetical protein